MGKINLVFDTQILMSDKSAKKSGIVY